MFTNAVWPPVFYTNICGENQLKEQGASVSKAIHQLQTEPVVHLERMDPAMYSRLQRDYQYPYPQRGRNSFRGNYRQRWRHDDLDVWGPNHDDDDDVDDYKWPDYVDNQENYNRRYGGGYPNQRDSHPYCNNYNYYDDRQREGYRYDRPRGYSDRKYPGYKWKQINNRNFNNQPRRNLTSCTTTSSNTENPVEKTSSENVEENEKQPQSENPVLDVTPEVEPKTSLVNDENEKSLPSKDISNIIIQDENTSSIPLKNKENEPESPTPASLDTLDPRHNSAFLSTVDGLETCTAADQVETIAVPCDSFSDVNIDVPPPSVYVDIPTDMDISDTETVCLDESTGNFGITLDSINTYSSFMNYNKETKKEIEKGYEDIDSSKKLKVSDSASVNSDQDTKQKYSKENSVGSVKLDKVKIDSERNKKGSDSANKNSGQNLKHKHKKEDSKHNSKVSESKKDHKKSKDKESELFYKRKTIDNVDTSVSKIPKVSDKKKTESNDNNNNKNVVNSKQSEPIEKVSTSKKHSKERRNTVSEIYLRDSNISNKTKSRHSQIKNIENTSSEKKASREQQKSMYEVERKAEKITIRRKTITTEVPMEVVETKTTFHKKQIEGSEGEEEGKVPAKISCRRKTVDVDCITIQKRERSKSVCEPRKGRSKSVSEQKKKRAMSVCEDNTSDSKTNTRLEIQSVARITRSKSREFGLNCEMLPLPREHASTCRSRSRSKTPTASRRSESHSVKISKKRGRPKKVLETDDDSDASSVSYKSSASEKEAKKGGNNQHSVPKIIPSSPVTNTKLLDPRLKKYQSVPSSPRKDESSKVLCDPLSMASVVNQGPLNRSREPSERDSGIATVNQELPIGSKESMSRETGTATMNLELRRGSRDLLSKERSTLDKQSSKSKLQLRGRERKKHLITVGEFRNKLKEMPPQKKPSFSNKLHYLFGKDDDSDDEDFVKSPKQENPEEQYVVNVAELPLQKEGNSKQDDVGTDGASTSRASKRKLSPKGDDLTNTPSTKKSALPWDHCLRSIPAFGDEQKKKDNKRIDHRRPSNEPHSSSDSNGPKKIEQRRFSNLPSIATSSRVNNNIDIRRLSSERRSSRTPPSSCNSNVISNDSTGIKTLEHRRSSNTTQTAVNNNSDIRILSSDRRASATLTSSSSSNVISNVSNNIKTLEQRRSSNTPHSAVINNYSDGILNSERRSSATPLSSCSSNVISNDSNNIKALEHRRSSNTPHNIINNNSDIKILNSECRSSTTPPSSCNSSVINNDSNVIKTVERRRSSNTPQGVVINNNSDRILSSERRSPATLMSSCSSNVISNDGNNLKTLEHRRSCNIPQAAVINNNFDRKPEQKPIIVAQLSPKGSKQVSRQNSIIETLQRRLSTTESSNADRDVSSIDKQHRVFMDQKMKRNELSRPSTSSEVKVKISNKSLNDNSITLNVTNDKNEKYVVHMTHKSAKIVQQQQFAAEGVLAEGVLAEFLQDTVLGLDIDVYETKTAHQYKQLKCERLHRAHVNKAPLVEEAHLVKQKINKPEKPPVVKPKISKPANKSQKEKNKVNEVEVIELLSSDDETDDRMTEEIKNVESINNLMKKVFNKPNVNDSVDEPRCASIDDSVESRHASISDSVDPRRASVSSAAIIESQPAPQNKNTANVANNATAVPVQSELQSPTQTVRHVLNDQGIGNDVTIVPVQQSLQHTSTTQVVRPALNDQSVGNEVTIVLVPPNLQNSAQVVRPVSNDQNAGNSVTVTSLQPNLQSPTQVISPVFNEQNVGQQSHVSAPTHIQPTSTNTTAVLPPQNNHIISPPMINMISPSSGSVIVRNVPVTKNTSVNINNTQPLNSNVLAPSPTAVSISSCSTNQPIVSNVQSVNSSVPPITANTNAPPMVVNSNTSNNSHPPGLSSSAQQSARVVNHNECAAELAMYILFHINLIHFANEHYESYRRLGINEEMLREGLYDLIRIPQNSLKRLAKKFLKYFGTHQIPDFKCKLLFRYLDHYINEKYKFGVPARVILRVVYEVANLMRESHPTDFTNLFYFNMYTIYFNRRELPTPNQGNSVLTNTNNASGPDILQGLPNINQSTSAQSTSQQQGTTIPQQLRNAAVTIGAEQNPATGRLLQNPMTHAQIARLWDQVADYKRLCVSANQPQQSNQQQLAQQQLAQQQLNQQQSYQQQSHKQPSVSNQQQSVQLQQPSGRRQSARPQRQRRRPSSDNVDDRLHAYQAQQQRFEQQQQIRNNEQWQNQIRGILTSSTNSIGVPAVPAVPPTAAPAASIAPTASRAPPSYPTALQMLNRQVSIAGHPEIPNNLQGTGQRVPSTVRWQLGVRSNSLQQTGLAALDRHVPPNVSIIPGQQNNVERNMQTNLQQLLLQTRRTEQETPFPVPNDNFRIRLPMSRPLEPPVTASVTTSSTRTTVIESPTVAFNNSITPATVATSMPNLSDAENVVKQETCTNAQEPPPLTVADGVNSVILESLSASDTNAVEISESGSSTPQLGLPKFEAIEDEIFDVEEWFDNRFEDDEAWDSYVNNLSIVKAEKELSQMESAAAREKNTANDLSEDQPSTSDPIPPRIASVDSGFSSPPRQIELKPEIALDRICICSKKAELVCQCKMAIYCSRECQVNNWQNHQEICLRTRSGEVSPLPQELLKAPYTDNILFCIL